MIAICPVGPPNEINPSFNQNRNASPNDGARCLLATPERSGEGGSLSVVTSFIPGDKHVARLEALPSAEVLRKVGAIGTELKQIHDMPDQDLDTTVKLAIYAAIAETGRVPNSSEVSRKLDIAENEIVEAFKRLHAKRLLLPEPCDPSRIRMAPPFSGIPTAFPVEANGKRYFANCVWDAYGIAAALHSDAICRASDGHTGEPLTLEVKNGAPVLKPYVAHFAVPAAHWWDDLVFT